MRRILTAQSSGVFGSIRYALVDMDFFQHMDYIHYNPAKHGHVKQVKDWPYSSFHRFVGKKIYPMDWGARIVASLTSIALENNLAWGSFYFPGFHKLHPGYLLGWFQFSQISRTLSGHLLPLGEKIKERGKEYC
ncbi:MAG: hypothetical protein KDF59_13540 [Nitrosomonas sp.]|nr:hypothetical protein [Nitrosomonas sp.]